MRALPYLAIGAVVTVVVGLLDGQGWPSFVIGALAALAMWVMLFAGSYAGETRGEVDPVGYAIASAIGIAIGGALMLVLDGSAYWSVGFIIAGVVWPAAGLARRDRTPG